MGPQFSRSSEWGWILAQASTGRNPGRARTPAWRIAIQQALDAAEECLTTSLALIALRPSWRHSRSRGAGGCQATAREGGFASPSPPLQALPSGPSRPSRRL